MVALDRPDVAIVDIRMPPTHTDEGWWRRGASASAIRRRRWPRLPAQGARLRHRHPRGRPAAGHRGRVRPRSHVRGPPHATQAPRLAAHLSHATRTGHPGADGIGTLQCRHRWRTGDQRTNRGSGVCPAVSQARPGALPGREPRARRAHAAQQLNLHDRARVRANQGYEAGMVRGENVNSWTRGGAAVLEHLEGVF